MLYVWNLAAGSACNRCRHSAWVIPHLDDVQNTRETRVTTMRSHVLRVRLSRGPTYPVTVSPNADQRTYGQLFYLRMLSHSFLLTSLFVTCPYAFCYAVCASTTSLPNLVERVHLNCLHAYSAPLLQARR